MNLLHVDSIQKKFGTKQVLSDVFISCDKNDIIGLVGRNGSGKSTLLQIIFGSVTAEQKFIKVEGRIIHGIKEGRNLINYLPQHHFLPSHVKIKKLITTFCTKKDTKLLIENKGIQKMLYKKSHELSGGERRLLEIYLIVCSRAKIILLDEPFNGISPIEKDKIKSLILQKSQNRVFIITDHDYRNILKISTKIVLLKNGCTKEIQDQKELVVLGYLSE